METSAPVSTTALNGTPPRVIWIRGSLPLWSCTAAIDIRVDWVRFWLTPSELVTTVGVPVWAPKGATSFSPFFGVPCFALWGQFWALWPFSLHKGVGGLGGGPSGANILLYITSTWWVFTPPRALLGPCSSSSRGWLLCSLWLTLPF